MVTLNLALVKSQTESDLEVVSRSHHFTISKNSMSVIDTLLIQVNNRNADTEINIPYSKGDKIDIRDAWIEDINGNIIRKLRKKDIKDRSNISSIALYEDDFVKYFDLRHDVFPYRIFYTSRIQYARSLNTIDIDHSWAKTPVESARVIVEVPLQDSIRYRYENIGEFTFSSDSRYKKYIWQYAYKPPESEDTNALKKDLKAPSIQIIPLNFHFGVEGSFDSWKSFGNWIFRLNKNRDKLTSDEIKKVDDLIKNTSSDRQKAEVLYRYLQNNTRYINVSIKLGGLQTHPASYVCNHKYGDCKALTNYMQAMLKHAGITSYYTLIDAGTKVNEIDEEFPTQAFNHVILTLPLEGDTLFLECTNNNIPFGHIGTSIQGRKALLVDEDNSHIIHIPNLEPADVITTRIITVDLDNEVVVLDEIAKGYKYELYSYLDSEVNKNNVANILRDLIFTGKAEMTENQFVKNDRINAEIGLKARFKAENLYRLYGNNLMLPYFSFGIKNYENPLKRTTGIQIDYPEFYTDTVTYNLKFDVVGDLPDPITIESDFGIYNQHFEMVESALVCYKSLLIYAGIYPLDVYSDFYQFISIAKSGENRKINLEIEL